MNLKYIFKKTANEIGTRITEHLTAILDKTNKSDKPQIKTHKTTISINSHEEHKRRE